VKRFVFQGGEAKGKRGKLVGHNIKIKRATQHLKSEATAQVHRREQTTTMRYRASPPQSISVDWIQSFQLEFSHTLPPGSKNQLDV